MLVTIIADASFCPMLKVGGYAYYAICDRGKTMHNGPLKGSVSTNIVAEMMAVVNGLHGAYVRGIVQPNDRLLIQTDCMAAIDAFEGKRTCRNDQELEVLAFYDRLRHRLTVPVEFRHVKGHTDGSTPRTHINNQCDAYAKEGMREARSREKKLRQKENAIKLKSLLRKRK